VSDPTGTIQAALIARYRGDTTLQGILSGYNAAIVTPEWNIFDQGGSGAITPVLPYVYVHPIVMSPGTLMSMGKDGKDVRMQVSVFTMSEGFAQARAIIARIHDLTSMTAGASALTLSGFSHIWTWFENRNELEQTTDVLIQHIADRYNVQVTV
jgi:hypothetical protein